MRRRLWLIFPLVGVLIRLISLSSYPAGFTADEAAFGYNSFSLLQTGRDEWGTPLQELPIIGLRSFGDYKLPLYSILAVPFVAVLGLTETAVRLPNALLSVLSIPVIYVLSRRLFKSASLAKFSVIFFSFSPWSVPLSRGAFEANLAIFFLSLGLALLVSSRHLSSALIFALGMYTYHTTRLVTPPLFIFSLFLQVPARNRLKSALLFLLLSLPACLSLLKFNARSTDVSLFNPDSGWGEMAGKRLDLINSGWPEPLAKLAANKIMTIAPIFIPKYLSYFSPKFLFQTGPGEASYGMLPGRGVTYFTDIVLLPLGIYYFLRSKSKNILPLLLLALISPVPAALTKGVGFAANRTAPLILPFTLLTAAGLEFIWRSFRSRLLVGLMVLSMVLLSISYFYHYKKDTPSATALAMGYGWEGAISRLLPLSSGYSEIRLSRSMTEPHMFLAFYSGFDPVVYQQAAADWRVFEARGYRFLDQMDGYWLENYRFGDINYDRPVNFPVLYLGRPTDFPAGTDFEVLTYYPNGIPAIVMAAKTGLDTLSFRL